MTFRPHGILYINIIHPLETTLIVEYEYIVSLPTFGSPRVVDLSRNTGQPTSTCVNEERLINQSE